MPSRLISNTKARAIALEASASALEVIGEEIKLAISENLSGKSRARVVREVEEVVRMLVVRSRVNLQGEASPEMIWEVCSILERGWITIEDLARQLRVSKETARKRLYRVRNRLSGEYGIDVDVEGTPHASLFPHHYRMSDPSWRSKIGDV